MYEQKLREMGIYPAETVKPLAAYIPAMQLGELVITSGQVPVENGELKYAGKVGVDLSLEEGVAAARLCAINCLNAVRDLIGSLDNVEQIVKLTGFVNCAEGFGEQPQVLNGASEFLIEVFGDAGVHTRSAVGVSGLPINSAVEIEMVVKVKQAD